MTKTTDAFNLDDMFVEDSVNINLTGSTGTGKSTILYHILNKYHTRFRHIYYFTGQPNWDSTGINNYVWEDHIFTINVSDKSSRDDISMYITKHQEWLSKFQDKPRTLLIFDDLGEHLRNQLKNIINTRHSRISMIILTHDSTNLEPSVKQNIQFSIYAELIDIRRSLKNLPTEIAKILDKQQAQILQESTKESKKYIVYDAKHRDSFYYYIIPKKDVDDLKDGKINILHNNESNAKDLIKEQILNYINE